jgi:hypothetical protein
VIVSSSEMKTSYNTVSGKDGSFLFKELSPGPAILFARPPPMPRQAAGDADAPRIEMLRTYYPSAADAATSAEIRLIPGDRNSGYDIRMIQQQVQRVRGVVRNSAGETVGGAQVDLQPALPNEPLRIRAWGDDDDFLHAPTAPFAAATTNAKGEFEFPSVPAGSWRLHSEGRSFLQMARQMKEPAESGELQVNVSRSDIDHADIRLERPFDLIVTYEGAANQASVPFLLVGMLTPSSGLTFPPFLTAKPEQLSNSSVVFHGISPGEYVVTPPRPPASYISVTVGGQEAIGRKVNLRAGTPLNITFSHARTSIGGTVDTPNSDARGISVLLFPPQEADLEPVRYISAGTGGDFKFEGLRPATYSVIAVREPDVASLSDLTLRGLRSKARSVRLEAGAAETLTLAVQAIQ